jgi:hypothetical protein
VTTQTLNLDEIVVDPEFQPRANALDNKHVEDLMVAYELPESSVQPMTVWMIEGRGNKPYLVKGFHRREALVRLKRKKAEFEVRHGTVADAILDAAGSNRSHGLKRTPADKRRAVEMVLQCHPDWSDRRLADVVGVSHFMVAEYRPRLESVSGNAIRVASDGRVNKVKVKQKEARNGNKSKPKAAPKPSDNEGDDDQADLFGESDSDSEALAVPAPPAGKLATYYRNDGVPDLPGVYRPRLSKNENGHETVLDAYDNPMPAGLGDTFVDPTLRRILANLTSLANDAEQIREQFDELKAARKAHQVYTWAEIPTVAALFETFRNTAVKLTDHLLDAIPYAVCPDCSGARKGCKACRGSGYWPRSECEVYPDRFRKGAAA